MRETHIIFGRSIPSFQLKAHTPRRASDRCVFAPCENNAPTHTQPTSTYVPMKIGQEIKKKKKNLFCVHVGPHSQGEDSTESDEKKSADPSPHARRACTWCKIRTGPPLARSLARRHRGAKVRAERDNVGGSATPPPDRSRARTRE